jgi:hypothetical protein
MKNELYCRYSHRIVLFCCVERLLTTIKQGTVRIVTFRTVSIEYFMDDFVEAELKFKCL